MPRPARDPLKSFAEFDFEYNGKSRKVYRTGEGPGILIMHELPGMAPETLAFARRLQKAGFSVYLPLLFGEAGKPASYSSMMGYTLQLCISREFYLLKKNQTSPILDWLRALCRRIHGDCGGPGVGAIGMCLTGSFSIPLMLEPAMIAPVLSQPSMPFCLFGSKEAKIACRRSIDISPEDLEYAKRRCNTEGLQIQGYKFSHDSIAPQERFERLSEEFGESFIPFTIDSSPGNANGYGSSHHAVFTFHYSNRSGSPTREAMERLVDFYRERLRA